MSANVLDQAQNVQGVVAAARFRDKMALREANSTNDAERRAAREAIFDVEGRFPDLGDVPVGGAEKFARNRGHGKGSRSPVHEGRQRSRTRAKGRQRPATRATPATRAAKPSTGSRRDASRGPARSASTNRRTRPSATPRVDRAIAQTGIPAAAGSTGSILMAALGGTVAAGLGYLVLSSSEQKGSGARAFPTAVDGLVRAVGRFLGPGDLFPDNTPAAAAAATSPQPNAPVQPHGRRAPARLPAQTRPHQFNHR